MRIEASVRSLPEWQPRPSAESVAQPRDTSFFYAAGGNGGGGSERKRGGLATLGPSRANAPPFGSPKALAQRLSE